MNKFSKFFSYLTLALGTVQAVRQVEQAVPEPGMGSHKLGIVVDTVTQAAMAVPEIQQDIQKKDADNFAAAVAKNTVAVLNAAGVFKNGPKPAN